MPHIHPVASACPLVSRPTAAPGPAIYKPRRPQETTLYRAIQRHIETFLVAARETADDFDSVPTHVKRTFREYLRCGILAHG